MVYGEPLGLAAMAHAPTNELGVLFLFGILAAGLGFRVERLQAAFPDCEAKREVAPGKWELVFIELELYSRNFKLHRHNPKGCHAIVCWKHNWPDCPEWLEVIELSKVVKEEILRASARILWHSRPRLWSCEKRMKIRKYDYRRNLPHIERSGRIHFITFDAYLRWELPPQARDLALKHCLHDHCTKMQLYIAVVMPDHVHLIFMPLEDEKHETFSFEEIVGSIKGASCSLHQ